MCFGVETRVDFVLWLDSDVAMNILMRLNDPADVVRSGAVSRLWHQFVVTNGISKKLCLRKFPQLARVACMTETNFGIEEGEDVAYSNSSWETIKREHKLYAFLLRKIEVSSSCPRRDCIGYAISDSSRDDDDPDGTISNTLDPGDRYEDIPSYWSSVGLSDPNAPETLIYELKSDLCVITEINIRPFEVYFYPGNPIYSAKYVRFRLGHLNSSRDESDLLQLPQQQPVDDGFIWTYTSDEFPMRQENCLQRFKLPEPVLCVGGYLQIELLGRAQRCDIDGLFYICICHVKARGRPLYGFGVENIEPSGDLVLRYRHY